MQVAAERRRAKGLRESDGPRPQWVQFAGERRRASRAYEPDEARPPLELVATSRITRII